MANFPLLGTGAVTQYPLPQVTAQGVRSIWFMDGTDQRFLTHGRQYRQWQIALTLLNENELFQVEAFFNAQVGAYSTFSFPDPSTGVGVPNCRLGTSELIGEYTGVDTGSISFWVIETDG